MAKEGNRSSGVKTEVKGPCTDCGTMDGKFLAIRRYGAKGKSSMVRLCQKCSPKV